MLHTLKDKKYIGVILLALCVVVLYGYRLNFPPEPYYDEVHYVRFLKKLIHEHTYDYASSHPPLWHLLTWGCMVLFGEHPVVWRLVSLLAGLLLLLWVYFLAQRISRDSLTALFTVFFLAFDCISLTQARIGMFNSLALLFAIIALWAFLHFLPERPGPRKKVLLSTGIFLGLGLATKLTSLSTLGIIYFLLILKAMKSRGQRKPLFFESIFFLGILPVVIYFAAHAFIPFLPGYSWKDIWKIQVFNFRYHLVEAATQTHLYASQWWGWPLLLRPIWYYFTNQEGVVKGIISIGNPAIFWMIPVMAVYLLWDFLRHKSQASGLILLGFFGQWLFYACGLRLKFFHYIYFAMPFVAIGLAWICRKLWGKGRCGKILVCLYLVLVLGMFLYWYPLLTGLPIPVKYFQQHMWFRSWI